VGLGLDGAESLTVEGMEAAKVSDKVYLEVYTSPTGDELETRLEELIGPSVERVGREIIEDGRRIIEESKTGSVALIVPGDPMVATTHMDLRIRAEAEGIKTRVIHNASILSAVLGETGLHGYSFGKTVTLARSGSALHTTVYNTVFENMVRRLHTLILLEYDQASDFFLEPKRAIDELLETEEELRQGLFDDETFLIVASRIGRSDQAAKGGRVSDLKRMYFGQPPHVLLVPGRLHFTETNALQTLLRLDESEVLDNSERVPRLATKMVQRYAKKTWSALSRARAACTETENRRYASLFENVECYVSDAERFINQGKDELAVLSTGYAEGLLDALTYLDGDKFREIWDLGSND
jgi:diphthine synthase